MYKTEYDRSSKVWFAWYENEDGVAEGPVGRGDTKEVALVDLGWNHCYSKKEST